MQLERAATPDESTESPLEPFVPFRPDLAPGVPLPAPPGCESVSAELATWCRSLPQPGQLRSVRHGPAVTFHPSGRLATHGQSADGEWEGRWRTWSDRGVLERADSYHAGREHGLAASFHPNGRRASETHFVHGKRHGVERFWTDKGELMTLCEWANDVRGRDLVFRYTPPQLTPLEADANLALLSQVGALQNEHMALAAAGRFDEAKALMTRIHALLARVNQPQ